MGLCCFYKDIAPDGAAVRRLFLKPRCGAIFFERRREKSIPGSLGRLRRAGHRLRRKLPAIRRKSVHPP